MEVRSKSGWLSRDQLAAMEFVRRVAIKHGIGVVASLLKRKAEVRFFHPFFIFIFYFILFLLRACAMFWALEDARRCRIYVLQGNAVNPTGTESALAPTLGTTTGISYTAARSSYR